MQRCLSYENLFQTISTGLVHLKLKEVKFVWMVFKLLFASPQKRRYNNNNNNNNITKAKPAVGRRGWGSGRDDMEDTRRRHVTLDCVVIYLDTVKLN